MPENSPHGVWRAAPLATYYMAARSHSIMGQPGLPHGHAHSRAGRACPGLAISYWAVTEQASGLGNLSYLDHTKLGGIQVCSVHMSVQVTGVSSVNRHRMGKTLL